MPAIFDSLLLPFIPRSSHYQPVGIHLKIPFDESAFFDSIFRVSRNTKISPLSLRRKVMVGLCRHSFHSFETCGVWDSATRIYQTMMIHFVPSSASQQQCLWSAYKNNMKMENLFFFSSSRGEKWQII